MNKALDGLHCAKAFHGSRGNVSGPATVIPLLSAETERTTLCKGKRNNEEEEDSFSPAPNPFPELIHSTIAECLLPWNKHSSTQVIKVYSEDQSSRAVEVPSDITARDVCQLFVLKNHCIDDHSWTLFEHLSQLGIERTIEDHESVMAVLSGWGMDSDSRLYFRKNYAKYEFFRKPLDFFPDHMVSISSETNGLVDHSQLIETFLSSSTCPEIHGHLHAKEQGRKSWKKFFFVLRRSGLYFSNKGTSKVSRKIIHLWI